MENSIINDIKTKPVYDIFCYFLYSHLRYSLKINFDEVEKEKQIYFLFTDSKETIYYQP